MGRPAKTARQPKRPYPAEQAMVGSSAPLRLAIERAIRVGPRCAPVLICGPTGSGKEGMAHLVHEASGRRGPFTPINCAALPEHLVESELFGHERGAFTGARERRQGLLEASAGGTVFLDEIGELPLSLQPKLLRVLEIGTIRRVGGTEEIPIDVRVVAATHRELPAMVQEGGFREDLYFRLRRAVVEVPPLKARGSDVGTLARHFLKRIAEREGSAPARLSRGAAALLRAHEWPGNARELEGVMEDVVIVQGMRRIEARHVAAALGLSSGDRREVDMDARIVAEVNEAGCVGAGALRIHLGLSKGDLQRRLQRLVAAGRLYRHGAGRGTRYSTRPGLAPTNEEAHRGSDPLDPPEQQALAQLARLGPAGRGEVAIQLGCSPRTATRILGRLTERGLVIRDGDGGRGVRYRVVDAAGVQWENRQQ